MRSDRAAAAVRLPEPSSRGAVAAVEALRLAHGDGIGRRRASALAASLGVLVLATALAPSHAGVLYSLDAGWFVIEDGVDTYHVENGLIRSQTRHGLITFTGPPPEQQ